MAMTLSRCSVAGKATVARPERRAAVACSAQKSDVPKAVAAAAAAALLLGQAAPAHADIAGLTPCSESKAYAKRLKNEVKALNKRLKNVSASAGRQGRCSSRTTHEASGGQFGQQGAPAGRQQRRIGSMVRHASLGAADPASGRAAAAAAAQQILHAAADGFEVPRASAAGSRAGAAAGTSVRNGCIMAAAGHSG